jgi:hypothetical protein
MARLRTSGENLFVVLIIMAPLSQKLEPPANPVRFNELWSDVLTTCHAHNKPNPSTSHGADNETLDFLRSAT